MFVQHRQSLVDEALGGDEEALDELLADVRRHVMAIAQSRIRDKDLAEDVAQEVIVKLLRGLGRLRSRSRFWPWVHRIALNEFVSCHRRDRAAEEFTRRLTRESTLRSAQEPDLAIDAHRLRDIVVALARGLPVDQRVAVERVCLDEYKPCEVAKETGRGRTTVRSSLCRGRRELARRLVETHPRFAEELGVPLLPRPSWPGQEA